MRNPRAYENYHKIEKEKNVKKINKQHGLKLLETMNTRCLCFNLHADNYVHTTCGFSNCPKVAS